MRRLLVIFLCSVLFCSTSYCQWQWLNPKPAGFPNQKIVFTTQQRGFILNSNGDLIKTTDQGTTWEIVNNFPKANIMDIKDSTGVIAGTNGALFISYDNGNSWQQNTTINDNFQFINIISRDTFFLTNFYGTIFKTFNRGQSWTVVSTSLQIGSIVFTNAETGFIGGTDGSINKTVDGGHTWQVKNSVSFFPAGILAMQFLNNDTGYAFRNSDSLLITTDGGNTWIGNRVNQTMYTIDFVNFNVGYVGGFDGAIYKTANGGITWTAINSPPQLYDGYDINSIAFVSEDTGFAVGREGRVLKTNDGGQTWTPYATTYFGINSVSFPNSSIAYFSNGVNIYKSFDGGQSWNALPLALGVNSTSYFDQMHFSNADSGFVITSNPALIYKTNDGGQTWQTIQPYKYREDDVTGISFLTPNIGFISLTGSAGLIIETTDGGNSWYPIWIGPTQGQLFTKILYLDLSTGFGINGQQLYETTDGSNTWNVIYASTENQTLSSVFFINKQKGFVGDDQGELFVTLDGGKTWNPVTLPSDQNQINAIKFFNDQIGYLVKGTAIGSTEYGNIYKTINGGLTWQLSENMGANKLELTPDSNIVAIGFAGTMLKSSVYGVKQTGINLCPNTNKIISTVLTGNSYQWQVNSGSGFTNITDNTLYTGTGSDSLLIKNTTTSMYGYQYRCAITNKSSVTYSDTYILKFAESWLGYASTAWENPFNWSCGVVPDSNTDVIINKGTVVLSSNTTVRSLILNPFVSLNINTPYNITVTH